MSPSSIPLPRSLAAVQRSLNNRVAKSDASSSDTRAPSVERLAMMICPSSSALPRSRDAPLFAEHEAQFLSIEKVVKAVDGAGKLGVEILGR